MAYHLCVVEILDEINQQDTPPSPVPHTPQMTITQGWRLTVRLKVKDDKKPVEMRAALVNGDKTLSETWSYQLPANE